MTKRNKIIYWVFTIWLALGMTSSSIVQLLRVAEAEESMLRLGYPTYLMTILGIWKILGVVTVLAPGFLRLKEWAYAGFFFTTSGAAISHIVMGDPIGEIIPALLLLTLTLISWYFRPESRKLVSLNNR
jgi:uncharacterized membrane protein YphA (DoxX/SURF4 family)